MFCELPARGEKHVPLATQVERIRRFYDPILAKVYENPEPRRRDLEQIEHIAGGYRTRRRFLTALTLDPPTSTADFAGPPTLDDDWLTLSTIHSAKGYEWDVVYLDPRNRRNFTIGPCWAGYFMRASQSFSPLIRGLDLPEGHQVFGAMMIGYAKHRYHRIPLRDAPRITWR